jgi:hypothetical protein
MTSDSVRALASCRPNEVDDLAEGEFLASLGQTVLEFTMGMKVSLEPPNTPAGGLDIERWRRFGMVRRLPSGWLPVVRSIPVHDDQVPHQELEAELETKVGVCLARPTEGQQ